MNIIYSKTTNNRKNEYKITTEIVQDDNTLFVRKIGGKSLEMASHFELLNKYYNVVSCEKRDDYVCFPFVKGVSLEEIMNSGKFEEALQIYKEFLNGPVCDFEVTEGFEKYFGEIKYKGKALAVSNIDMVFSNIIVNDEKAIMIDYEWTVNFPVPVDFIAYRALKLYFEHYPNTKLSIDECMKLLNVSYEPCFDDMIMHFNELVEDNVEDYKNKEHYIFSALGDSHKEINRLNDHINELGSWGQSLDIKIRDLDGRLVEKNNEVNYLSSEVHKLKEDVSSKEDIIQRRNETIEILNVKFEDKLREANRYKGELSFTQEQLTNTKNELSSTRDNLSQTQSELNITKDNLSETQNVLTNTQNELNTTKNNLSQTQNELNTTKDNLSQTQNELNTTKDNLSQTQNELNTTKDNLSQTQNELNTTKDNLSETQNVLTNTQNELNTTKNNLSETQNNLTNRENELNHIKGSTTYRLSLKYFKVRDFLLPPNSKRRLFVKVMLKAIRHPIWFIKHLTPANIKKFFKYSKTEGNERVLERLNAYQENNTEVKYSTELDLMDMKPRNEYPVLELPKCDKPLVSIIIPVYNQFSYTYGCIESIIKNTKEIDYEVIIGDDCSTDETVHLNKYVKNIKINKNKVNTRFLLNCKNAVKKAKGMYLLFLNNDTNVQWNWLKSLIDTMETYPNAGMVGSKLVYPTGKLQEAGGILWKDGSAWNYGNKSDPEASEYNYRKPVDYISGAAIMIGRKLWDEIGGFDETFCPAYCEDSDLAFEVRKRGYEVVYDPFSVVVHYEGVSNGTDVSTGVKKYQVDNTKKFYEKWKDVLEKHYPNAENVFVARERSYDKKTILMIDHYVPHYDKDAGSRTVFGYLKLMCEMGYNVKFIGENFYRHEPYTKELQKMGVEVLYGPHYANNWKNWLEINGKNFDFVFFNRPHITEKFIDDVKRYCNNAKFIYYGHDLHYVRINREYELKKDPSLIKESEKWKKVEFSLFDKVDLVYYPSILEVNEIKKEKKNLNARVLQPYLFPKMKYNSYNPKKRSGILFIGGFRHSPNFDGIMWFIEQIMPKIMEKDPSIKLYIAGSYPPQELLDKASDNIIIKGFVTDEELKQLYQSVRLVVVPLRYGAGIKGKVVEAMNYNVPIITTPCGAEGILSDAIRVEEDFASLVEYYNDFDKLISDSKKEYEYILKEYTSDSAKEKLEKDFKEI